MLKSRDANKLKYNLHVAGGRDRGRESATGSQATKVDCFIRQAGDETSCKASPGLDRLLEQPIRREANGHTLLQLAAAHVTHWKLLAARDCSRLGGRGPNVHGQRTPNTRRTRIRIYHSRVFLSEFKNSPVCRGISAGHQKN